MEQLTYYLYGEKIDEKQSYLNFLIVAETFKIGTKSTTVISIKTYVRTALTATSIWQCWYCLLDVV